MAQRECVSVRVCVTLFMVILPNEALGDESHTQSWILNKRSVRGTQQRSEKQRGRELKKQRQSDKKKKKKKKEEIYY